MVEKVYSGNSKRKQTHNCGVYRIVNTRTGDFYIGSTINFEGRKKEHFDNLRAGTHNYKFQPSYDEEIDKSVFVFERLVICLPDDRVSYEQACIDVFEPSYNVSKIAGAIDWSYELRERQKEIMLDFYKTPRGREWLAAHSERIRKHRESMTPEEAADHGRRTGAGLLEFYSSEAGDVTKEILSTKLGGENGPAATIDNKTALLIYRALGTDKEIAAKFGVTPGIVYFIKCGYTFTRVTKAPKTQRGFPKGSNHVNSKLTEEKALAIYNSSLSYKQLKVIYGVSSDTIYQIKAGKSWKHIHLTKAVCRES